MKKYITFLLIINSLIINLYGANDYQNSIVKIFSTNQTYNYTEPWKTNRITKSSATGFVIEGNRILTNAHAVTDSKYLQVRFDNRPEKVNAEVEFISVDYDLAILKFSNPEDVDNLKPLKFGDLPKVKDKVTVCGFPKGGDRLSFTEGIISRIQYYNYAYSKKKFTVLQTDAAINSGNSGGPVLKDGVVIGVAFQALGGGFSRGSVNNIGYVIPSHIIKHFLKDVQDGEISSIPVIGFNWTNMESKVHRNMLGMDEEQTGILIKEVLEESLFKENFKKNDIIMSINGYDVGIDGSIEFRTNERIHFNYLLEQKHYGDELTFTLLRDKKIVKEKIELKKPNKSIISDFKEAPTYFITSGFVFEKLTVNLKGFGALGFLFGGGRKGDLASIFKDPPKDVEEIILIMSVLSDDANIGYQDLRSTRIVKVNGESVSNFKDFINKLHEKRFAVLEDSTGREIVIDNELSKERDAIIQQTYNIPEMYSFDLKEFIVNKP